MVKYIILAIDFDPDQPICEDVKFIAGFDDIDTATSFFSQLQNSHNEYWSWLDKLDYRKFNKKLFKAKFKIHYYDIPIRYKRALWTHKEDIDINELEVILNQPVLLRPKYIGYELRMVDTNEQ